MIWTSEELARFYHAEATLTEVQRRLRHHPETPIRGTDLVR
jgi:hypothetical protein